MRRVPMNQQVEHSRLQYQAAQQAKILANLGVQHTEIRGKLQNSSQMSNEPAIVPKSRAKFFMHEQKFNKLYKA